MKKSLKKTLTTITLAVIALSLSNCASIVSKSQYPVSVRSAGSPVPFTVKNSKGETLHSAKTPTILTLSASEGFFKAAKYDFTFTKNGKIETQSLDASMDGWFAGNLLFGGVIGVLIVDPATGAMWKLEDQVNTSL